MKAWLLADQLGQIKQQHLYRSRKVVDSAQGACIEVNGESLVNFSSNDYLNLANHAGVKKAYIKAAETFGVGSGSAHLICGHSSEHHALEEELAAFTGRSRALVFSTGYMANVGTISALVAKEDAIFQDKLNHASLLDGGKLSAARQRRYLHNDLSRLERLLAQSSANRKLVVSDGVFSMDGDQAKVKALAELSAKYDAGLMIDDAHGIGVLGQTGAGLLEQEGVSEQQVPILMATFGKALGTAGAFIAGSDELIEFLIQRSRPYVYTTAPPAAVMAATRASLKICQQQSWRRETLKALIQRFRTQAKELGLNLLESSTPIQPIIVGSSEKALRACDYLITQGYLATAIRSPTVAKGSERIRITLSCEHTEQQIDGLLETLVKALQS